MRCLDFFCLGVCVCVCVCARTLLLFDTGFRFEIYSLLIHSFILSIYQMQIITNVLTQLHEVQSQC